MPQFDAFSFIAGIGSALIIALTVFFGTEWLKTRWLRQSVARALLAEVTALRANHMEVIGKRFDETPDGTLPMQQAIFGDGEAFPLFNKLSIHLGIFPKHDAERLAQCYTEATSFRTGLRHFCWRMQRMDELNIGMQQAATIGDQRIHLQLQQEWNLLHQSQILYFGRIKSLNRRITGEVFDEVKKILERHG